MSPSNSLPPVAALSLLCSVAIAQTTSFSDQTVAAGITGVHVPTYNHSYAAGGAVGDFNRDGYQDIYLPSGGNLPDRLFLNNGDGTFDEVAAAWGIAVSHRGTGATVADFDNDGWLDLFVTSLGPSGASAAGHHKLYRNDQGHGFTDVAAAMGVNSTGTADGWGGAFGDYDNDGDLDLAVCGFQQGATNKLFRNDGATFTDVTASAGLAAGLSNISGFAIKFVDMDGDLDQDLIWIGDFSTSRYFVNNGNGTFTDFTAASGTSMDGTEMGVTVADFNEDGLFDFYVTTINTNNLYINQGGNVFANVATGSGAVSGGWGWGTVAIDMNHDTRIDLLSTTQSLRQYAWRNVSQSPQNVQFQETALSIGLLSTANGRGLSNIDYDNDGDQDLVIFPYGGSMVLYRNDLSAPDTHWLRVFLDNGCSTTIPADGVGAVVRATVGNRTWMHAIEAGTNYLSNSELSAHFGLGAATIVDTLSVTWPDGQVTTLSNVPADQTMTIRAPATAACSAPVGPGCSGTNGVPTLLGRGGSVPALGASFTVDLDNLDPSGAPALLAAALSPLVPGLELSSFGMPGCRVYVGTTATNFFTLANVGGAASWTLVVPNQPSLQGHEVYMQGVVFDPGMPNAFGAVLSNGLRASIY